MKISLEQLETPIAELESLGVPVRVVGILERAGYVYISDLVAVSASTLLLVRQFGPAHLEALKAALREFLGAAANGATRTDA